MNFSFREEEISKMYQMYKETLDEVQERTKGVVNELSDHAKEMKYKPVIDLAIASIDYYNNKLKAEEIKAFHNWKEGEISFTAIMKKLCAGEEAEARSRQLEYEIEEQINSWIQLDSSQFTGIQTSGWAGTSSEFNSIRETIRRFGTDLESILERVGYVLREKKEENGIYASIGPVILQSIKIVIYGFQNAIEGSFVKLEEVSNTRAREVRAMADEVEQNLDTQIQAAVSIDELMTKVKTIFE